MSPTNVDIHRAGHRAFNSRDFEAMTRCYADSITWTDHARGTTFLTRLEFVRDFLPVWVTAASDILIDQPTYLDPGAAVACTFTVVASPDGPLGPSPATGRPFTLPLCELWRFDAGGRVIGGDLYYDQA